MKKRKYKRNPLKDGYSPEVIGENIAHELKVGKSHAQAIATALDIARRTFKKANPGKALPKHLEELPITRAGFMFAKKNPVKKRKKRKYSRLKYAIVNNKAPMKILLGKFADKDEAISWGRKYANRTGKAVALETLK